MKQSVDEIYGEGVFYDAVGKEIIEMISRIGMAPAGIEKEDGIVKQKSFAEVVANRMTNLNEKVSIGEDCTIPLSLS